MKRLHPLSDRERIVAEGEYLWQSAHNQLATIERWELTRFQDGGQIYRVEVGDGAGLWHLMLTPDGRPDRLQVRLHAAAGHRFDATYTFFEDEVMIASRPSGKPPQKEFIDLPPGIGLLWVPFAGRELTLAGYDWEAGHPQAVMVYLLRQRPPERDWLNARPVKFSVERGKREMVDVPAGSFDAESFKLTVPGLPDQRGWFDQHGMVLKWQLGSQTPAVLNHYRRVASQQ